MHSYNTKQKLVVEKNIRKEKFPEDTPINWGSSDVRWYIQCNGPQFLQNNEIEKLDHLLPEVIVADLINIFNNHGSKSIFKKNLR